MTLENGVLFDSLYTAAASMNTEFRISFRTRVEKNKLPDQVGNSIEKIVVVNSFAHDLSTPGSAFHTGCPQRYPQVELWGQTTRCMVIAPSEKAKRPGAPTPGPLLVTPSARTSGETVPDSTRGRHDAAHKHLELLREQHDRLDRDDRYYVQLAFTYGLTVPEIAEASGLTFDRIRALLGGGR